MTPPDIAAVAGKLSPVHVAELRRILDEDQGYMARGDPSGLTPLGLAIAPMGQGFYRLSRAGLALRQHLLEIGGG